MILYGIKNCDTVKKARRWLEDNDVEYQFHDVRADGLTLLMIVNWLTALSPQQLLNKRSTTWKNLDIDVREQLADEQIPNLLVAHPTLVKRPVLEKDGIVMVGFNADTYASALLP